MRNISNLWRERRAGRPIAFGRVTYQMMASYWPTPMAEQHMPEVAKGMNRMREGCVLDDSERSGVEQYPAGQGQYGRGSSQDEERSRDRE